jgi:hypothetical protein
MAYPRKHPGYGNPDSQGRINPATPLARVKAAQEASCPNLNPLHGYPHGAYSLCAIACQIDGAFIIESQSRRWVRVTLLKGAFADAIR